MAAFTIQLPDELATFVEEQVRIGQFASPQDYLEDLLKREQRRLASLGNHRLEDQTSYVRSRDDVDEKLNAGRKLLEEAIGQMERGEGTVWTREVGRSLLQESLLKAQGVFHPRDSSERKA